MAICRPTACILAVLFTLATANGQEKPLQVRAFSGEPFGVAELVLDQESLKASFPIEKLGREALYPVRTKTGFRFLFNPTTSTHVTVDANKIPLKVTPDSNETTWKQELEKWWKAYSENAAANRRLDNMPLQVDQYLTTMLAQRLKLKLEDVDNATFLPDSSEGRFIALLTGAESIRVALQKETLLHTGANSEIADQPIPEPVLPPAVEIPEPAADVEIEPLAMHIPPEFFYVRFSGYEDLSWARKQVDELGTDVRDFLNARAFDHQLSKRIEDQLELRDSAIAQLLGPHVIDDIAIIGTDTFLREGAGIGIVFHAKANEALRQNLEAQRANRQKTEPNATLSEVVFDGDSGRHSFLSTPDNRLRSFYVQFEDYHLITTSRHIAERFLEVCRSPESSLGALKEFRYARTVMPLSRKDQVFLHLSDPFFRSFTDPKTRIEMTRRAKSENEIELLAMAKLAAKAEGHSFEAINELTSAGFLPTGFGQRPDGSTLKWDGDRMLDSVRGARGAFLPIADVELDKATRSEVEAYGAFSSMYMRLWRRMDPASVAIRRNDEGEKERLVVDLHVCPFPVNDYGWLGWFQPEKDHKQLAPVEGLVLLAEGDLLNLSQVIAGLADFEPDAKILESMKRANEYYHTPPSIVGERWNESNKIGLFGDKIPADLPDDTVKELGRFGFSNCVMRTGGFVCWSEEKDALKAIAGKIREVDAPRAAKVRVHVFDIKNAKATKIGHVVSWLQARLIADGNASLLRSFATQFRVPPENATSAVEDVFNSRLVHPLRGNWVLKSDEPIGEENVVDRMAYRQPLLDRLRGAELELNTEANVLTTHIELLLDKSADR